MGAVPVSMKSHQVISPDVLGPFRAGRTFLRVLNDVHSFGLMITGRNKQQKTHKVSPELSDKGYSLNSVTVKNIVASKIHLYSIR